MHLKNRCGRFGVPVWAWISYEGSGVCWEIDGHLTGIQYKDILDNIMLSSVRVNHEDGFI